MAQWPWETQQRDDRGKRIDATRRGECGAGKNPLVPLMSSKIETHTLDMIAGPAEVGVGGSG